MRIGVLFLVLQTLLLCVPAQAESALSKAYKAEAVAAQLLAGKNESCSAQRDSDGDLQVASREPAVASELPTVEFSAPLSSLVLSERTYSSIRAPPFSQ